MRLLTAILSAALAATAPAADLRIACVGDSITAGYGASQGSSYPDQLTDILGLRDEPVLNCGISGTTLARHSDAPYWDRMVVPGLPLLTQVAARQPDVVLLMLGTNDAKPQNRARKPDLAADYRDMVAILRGARSHPTVYAMLPLPVFADGAYRISPTILTDEVLPVLDRTAGELQLPRIDVRSAFRDHPELLPDTVHPKASGYRLLAQTVADALRTCPVFPCRGGEFIGTVAVAIAAPATGTLRYTLDGSLPVAGSPAYGAPITLDHTATVTAAVFTDGGSGLPASATFTCAAPRPPRPAAGGPGLRCAVYEPQPGKNIWRMEWEESLLARTVDVPGFGFAAVPTVGNAALVFTGGVTVPADGVYIFSTTSDDGSTLAVDGEVVVENGVAHKAHARSGGIALAAGRHDIELRYYNGGRRRSLAVTWAGPGLPEQPIPDSVCTRPAEAP